MQREQRRTWFGAGYEEPPSPGRDNGWHVIWFNPWQHQFDETPLIALLHEIRQHFSLTRKMFNETGKLLDVTVHATLNSLHELAKTLKLPLPIPAARGIMERGREYEAEQLAATLPSQRFRDFFEKALEAIIGQEGRMVIFIDDLDRCEGEVAYRLLESLKLYLNARNCIYVLGLDQGHLEETIARVLSNSEEARLYRPLAREYLGKMFQSLFLLPVPASTEAFIETLLDPSDTPFRNLLQQRFGLAATAWSQVITTLDRHLPHNPRKLKAFMATWKLYVALLAYQQAGGTPLDWRLTLILNYLGQFEEPLFRKIEEAPGFYSDQVVRFCRDGISRHPLFDGLELPYQAVEATAEATGGLGGTPTLTAPASDQSTAPRAAPISRVFWVSGLVESLSNSQFVSPEIIRRHLVRTGGMLSQPASPGQNP